jgi:hypothetical protein
MDGARIEADAAPLEEDVENLTDQLFGGCAEFLDDFLVAHYAEFRKWASISPNASYGQRIADHYSNETPVKYFNKRTDPSVPIKSVAKQNSESRGDVPVISKHIAVKGTRAYYATSWHSFHGRVYPKFSGTAKSFYENVYSSVPCRLYVDVDASWKESYGTYDAFVEKCSRRMRPFVEACKALIETAYPECIVTDAFVLDSTGNLDAKPGEIPTRTKFSRHVMFHVNDDDVKFDDSSSLLHLFRLVRVLSISNSKAPGEPDPENPFFVKLSPDQPATFVPDMSVYGASSREFRILDSCKYGENRPLTMKEHIVYSETGDEMRSSPEYLATFSKDVDKFCDTLICYTKKGKKHSKTASFSLPRLSKDQSTLEESFSKTARPGGGGGGGGGPASKITESACGGGGGVSVEDSDVSMSLISSEYETLPESIKRTFDRCNDETRKRTVFSKIANSIMDQVPGLDDLTVSRFYLAGGRYSLSFSTKSKHCSIKGDDHTSNHVFYVANLGGSMTWYQRCWSPGCIQLLETKNAKEASLSDDASVDRALKSNSKSSIEENRNISCKSDTMYLDVSIWEEVDSLRRDFDKLHASFRSWKIGAYVDEPENRADSDEFESFDSFYRKDDARSLSCIENIDFEIDDACESNERRAEGSSIAGDAHAAKRNEALKRKREHSEATRNESGPPQKRARADAATVVAPNRTLQPTSWSTVRRNRNKHANDKTLMDLYPDRFKAPIYRTGSISPEVTVFEGLNASKIGTSRSIK